MKTTKSDEIVFCFEKEKKRKEKRVGRKVPTTWSCRVEGGGANAEQSLGFNIKATSPTGSPTAITPCIRQTIRQLYPVGPIQGLVHLIGIIEGGIMCAIQYVDGHKLEGGVRGKAAWRSVIGEHLKDLKGGA